MKRCSSIATVIVLLLLTPLVAQDLAVQLQRAIQQETVAGDLKAAIADYEAIVKRAGTNKVIAAQALVRLADAHRKLGQAQAKTIYEQILREYADQPEAVAHARAALDVLGQARIPNKGRSSRAVWSDADAMGSPSADGRFFSLVDWETGDLALRDMAAGTNRRLTSKGTWEQSPDFAEFSVLSPDGGYVAYAWAVLKPSEHYELRVVATTAAASRPRVLDTGEWIQPGGWSADGRRLVYLRQASDKASEIVMISLPDGRPRVLARDSTLERPTISPDGKYVAYAAQRPNDGERDIFILFVDGGEPRPIQHPANDWLPLFTPDGGRLLFISSRSGRRALWSLPMRAGTPAGPAELVERDVSLVTGVTRDGAVYHFSGGQRSNVLVATMDGSAAEPQLISELYLNEANSPSWAPDGQSVAFYATVTPAARVANKAIVIRSMANGSARTILPQLHIAPGIPAGLRWFPDGRSLLVVSRTDNTFGFHRVDSATGAAERLMETAASNQGANGPDISSDGRTLFYLRQNPTTDPAGPPRTIVRRDLASGSEVGVKSGWFTAIALSPDGRRLAYLGNETSGTAAKQAIAVMPGEGGTPQVLFEGEWPRGNRANIITWDPGGRFVYFVRQDGGVAALWRVPAGGGSAEKTAVSFKGNMASPHVHPDGKRVAFTASEPNVAEMWLLENYLPPRNAEKK